MGLPGVVQSDFNVGPGASPSSTFGFLAPTARVTVNSGERVLVTSFKALGSAGGASGLNLEICARAVGALNLFPAVPNAQILGMQVPANTRVPMGLTAVLTCNNDSGMSVGSGSLSCPQTYDVGLCGNSVDPNWNNNEWGYTSAVVFNAS